LRQILDACDRVHEGAMPWLAEVQRRGLFRQLGRASFQLCTTQAPGFSVNHDYQLRWLADDLDRLPTLREAVATNGLCRQECVRPRHGLPRPALLSVSYTA
jgi:hypothetical protein